MDKIKKKSFILEFQNIFLETDRCQTILALNLASFFLCWLEYCQFYTNILFSSDKSFPIRFKILHIKSTKKIKKDKSRLASVKS